MRIFLPFGVIRSVRDNGGISFDGTTSTMFPSCKSPMAGTPLVPSVVAYTATPKSLVTFAKDMTDTTVSTFTKL